MAGQVAKGIRFTFPGGRSSASALPASLVLSPAMKVCGSHTKQQNAIQGQGFAFILCALVFYLHVCLYEGVRSPGTGDTDSCELTCGCWELNPGPLKEQPVPITAEPSLQPPQFLSFKKIVFLCMCVSVSLCGALTSVVWWRARGLCQLLWSPPALSRWGLPELGTHCVS